MKRIVSLRAALLAGLLALASHQPAFAGGVSGTPGTLDATLVDPPTSAQYPHFLCSGCSAGGGAVTNAGTFPVQPDGVVDGQTIPFTNGSGTGTNAVLIPSISTVGYASVLWDEAVGATGASVLPQFSFDQTNWFNAVTFQASSYGPAGNGIQTGYYFYSPITGPYMRVIQNSATSGTTSGFAVLKRQQALPSSIYVNQGGNPWNVLAQSGYNDSITALGASATFTGTGRSNYPALYDYFVATAYADQAGTLQIQQSLDSGSTYQTISSTAVSAGIAVTSSIRVTGQAGLAYYRVQFVNGSTAQGTFRLSSGFTAN